MRTDMKKLGPFVIAAAAVGGIWALSRKAEEGEEPGIPGASGEFSLVTVERGIGAITTPGGLSSSAVKVGFSGKVTAGNTPLTGLKLTLKQIVGGVVFSTDTTSLGVDVSMGATYNITGVVASTPIPETLTPSDITAEVTLESSAGIIGTITSPVLGTIQSLQPVLVIGSATMRGQNATGQYTTDPSGNILLPNGGRYRYVSGELAYTFTNGSTPLAGIQVVSMFFVGGGLLFGGLSFAVARTINLSAGQTATGSISVGTDKNNNYPIDGYVNPPGDVYAKLQIRAYDPVTNRVGVNLTEWVASGTLATIEATSPTFSGDWGVGLMLG